MEDPKKELSELITDFQKRYNIADKEVVELVEEKYKGKSPDEIFSRMVRGEADITNKEEPEEESNED